MFDKALQALIKFGTAADTFSDRLNSKYTSALLVLFCVLVSTKQYVGEPISCWCPANYASTHVDFANKVCWVTNTYYFSFNNTKLLSRKTKMLKYINYYQWVPLILIAQAILFIVPRVFWKSLNTRKGISIMSLVDSIYELQKPGAIDPDKRKEVMNYAVKHFTRFLIDVDRKKQIAAIRNTFSVSSRSCYLSVLFITTKIMYFANAFGQLFLLNLLFTMKTRYRVFGIQVWKELDEDIWTTAIYFPRVTMCDFKVRRLGSVHKETVQCALTVNLFNEKVYIFIWFWFVLVSIVSLLSLLKWIFLIAFEKFSVAYVGDRLMAMKLIWNLDDQQSLKNSDVVSDTLDEHIEHIPEEKLVRKFVANFLRRDGVLILRLLSEHATDLIASEAIVSLFELYKQTKNLHRLSDQDQSTINRLRKYEKNPKKKLKM